MYVCKYACYMHIHTHYVYEISEHIEVNNVPCTACLRVPCVIHSILSTAAVGGGDCGVLEFLCSVYTSVVLLLTCSSVTYIRW